MKARVPARLNPFAGDRIARKIPFDPAWCDTSWDTLLERLAGFRHRALVAGPHGSGKTTFLDGLAPRLEDQGYRVVRWLLNDDHPRPGREAIRDLASGDRCQILLIDGAERLKWLAWRRIAAATETRWGGLVVTRHRISGELPLLLATRSTPEMLEAFLERLAPVHNLSSEAIRRLHSGHGGNLRDALWWCYDHAGDLTGYSPRPNPVES